MARQFHDVWDALEISYDDFIQTSEDRHHIGCRKFIQAVYDAGDIYKKAYAGLYCDGCEAFKTEKEIVDGALSQPPQSDAPPGRGGELLLRAVELREPLARSLRGHPDFIQPESRRNEIVNLVESGLQDVSISRKGFTWGIPVPFDPEQTIYVWFDALLNYITAIGYGTDEARFQTRLAGRCSCDRQGHHSVPLRPLAGDADVGGLAACRNRSSGTGSCTTRGRRSASRRARPSTRWTCSSSSWRRRVPLLLHEAMPLRRRRRLLARNGSPRSTTRTSPTTSETSTAASLTMCVKYFDGKLEGSSAFDAPRWRPD